MEREVVIKRVKSIKKLRKVIQECLIEHSEQRAKALITGNLHAFCYEQGWIDCLKTVKDLISPQGLMMYRYVFEVEQKREEDANRDTF